MAIKVFCQSCEKFIKNAEEHEFQKLTGKEMCVECGDKVKQVYKSLDDKIKEFNAYIEKTGNLTKTAYTSFHAQAQSLYTTTRAEIDAEMRNILEGEKGGKK